MEWESDSSCSSHTYPGQGCRSPGRRSNWELEFRDFEAIPGQGLLLTVERWIEGMWWRRLWWEIPVEESWAAMKARWYCWVTYSGWSHHHNFFLPTRLHQQLNREALNYRVGPHPECSLSAWNADLQSRTPAKEALQCAWCTKQQRRTPTNRATEKDWPKRPSNCQLPEARKKDSDRTITPVMEAVCVPAHLVPPGSSQAKQLCHLHAQLSLGQSCHRQKKVLHLCVQGRFSRVKLFAAL